jgi:hypothetical protein
MKQTYSKALIKSWLTLVSNAGRTYYKVALLLDGNKEIEAIYFGVESLLEPNLTLLNFKVDSTWSTFNGRERQSFFIEESDIRASIRANEEAQLEEHHKLVWEEATRKYRDAILARSADDETRWPRLDDFLHEEELKTRNDFLVKLYDSVLEKKK